MDERQLGTIERFVGPRGVLELASPTSGVLFSRFVGDLMADHARVIAARVMREVVVPDTLVCFSDWEGMESYESEARVVLTDVSRRVRGKMDRIHVLVRSRVVALGIDAANLVLGLLVSYSDRAAFEKALVTELNGRAARGR